MKILTTALFATLSAIAYAASAGAAFAQSDWTLGGITFDNRDGWCSKHAVQGGVQALEIRPCTSEFPYLSAGVAIPANEAKDMNLANVLASAKQNSAGDDNRARVLKLVTDKYGACTTLSFSVEDQPIPGIAGFSTIGSYQCAAAPGGRVDYRNFATLIRRPNGDIWAVAFDYPTGPLTAADSAMITSAIGRIAAAP